MELQAELVHAEAGRRVVRVSAHHAGRCLGSALGEAEDAETAEERAIARLTERLTDRLTEEPPASPPPPAPAPGSATPSAAAPAKAPPPQPSPAKDTERSAPTTAAPAPDPTAEGAHPVPDAPSATEPAATGEPPMDPEDWSQELIQLDLQLQRLGWSREQEGIYLQRAFGHPSRSRLTRWADLTAFLRALEELAPGADPASAPVPLRRRDLLAQGDALLEQLGWDNTAARRFLTRELGANSRQQLSDAQLLQFNMLLEEAWMAATPSSAAAQPGAGRGDVRA
ncbi:MAG: hypothetical protein VKJ05_04205 [Synechococcaceae cyanobacterium]|nr:hypothetical protein [Synechococcaceae cyanobacterium]